MPILSSFIHSSRTDNPHSVTASQTGVDKAFVDALNINADTLDGSHASAFASVSHTHVASDVTDLGNAATRDYTVSTGSPSGGADGDVHYQV